MAHKPIDVVTALDALLDAIKTFVGAVDELTCAELVENPAIVDKLLKAGSLITGLALRTTNRANALNLLRLANRLREERKRDDG